MPESVSPSWGRALTIAIAAIGAAVTIWTGVAYDWRDAALMAPWMALLTLICWATFWRPRVTVSDAGVELVNVTRTIFVPWPALHDLETRWALTLVTAYGNYTAWSAPAPGARSALISLRGARKEPARGRQPAEVIRPGELVDTPSGSAAALVRHRWDRMRAAGHLDEPRLERERAQVTWHLGTGLAIVALLTVGIVTSL